VRFDIFDHKFDTNNHLAFSSSIQVKKNLF